MEDWKAARRLSVDPSWIGQVHDACTVVILATSHGWKVDEEVLEVVRTAAGTPPALHSKALWTRFDPSDPDDDPSPNER
ncbi:MAG: hypothetical protein MI806_27660 [Minwuiales bacterium]|nr:hypothetical protein [Minwuiales bacterium]